MFFHFPVKIEQHIITNSTDNSNKIQNIIIYVIHIEKSTGKPQDFICKYSKKTSKVKQRNKWAKKHQKQNNSIYQNVSEGIKLQNHSRIGEIMNVVYFLKESIDLQCYLNCIMKIFVKEMEPPHAALFKFLTTYSLSFAGN